MTQQSQLKSITRIQPRKGAEPLQEIQGETKGAEIGLGQLRQLTCGEVETEV